MIVSACCKSDLTLVETENDEYFACTSCNLIANAVTILALSDLEQMCQNNKIEVKNECTIMKWLLNNIGKVLSIPTAASAINVVIAIANAMSDGVITDDEWHSIINASQGIELVFLTLALALLKVKNQK